LNAGDARPQTRSIDEILAEARTRIRRLDPAQTLAALRGGAFLIDMRPVWQRVRFGDFPDAILIDRNHLEWRLDPASDARIKEATGYDVEYVIACQEGYSSSLAAATLVDIGLHKTADLTGGFEAWVAAGLPIEPGPDIPYRGEDIAPIAATVAGPVATQTGKAT
jgi:rhodanese-related sulfurtransferase